MPHHWEKYSYELKFKSGVILSLLIILLTVLFFPAFQMEIIESQSYQSGEVITVIDIPNTDQKEGAAKAKSIPPKPELFIVMDEDIELLPDIEIEETTLDASEDQVETETGTEQGTGPIQASSLPFVPRQVLEVIPKNIDDDTKGRIALSLMIGKDGKAKQHKVLVNTIRNEKSLEKVLSAAYNSKWQPVVIEGDSVEFWIEKRYSFN